MSAMNGSSHITHPDAGPRAAAASPGGQLTDDDVPPSL